MVMSLVGAATALVLEPLGVCSALPLDRLVSLGELVPPIGPRCTPLRFFALALLAGWMLLLVTSARSVLIQPAKGLVIAPFVEGEHLVVHLLAALVAVLVGAELGALPVLRSRCHSSPSRTCRGTRGWFAGERSARSRRRGEKQCEDSCCRAVTSRASAFRPVKRTPASLIGRAGMERGGSSVASDKTLPPGSEFRFAPGGSRCTSRSGSPAHRLRDRGLGRVTAGVRVQVPTDGNRGRRVGALHEHGRGSEHVRGGG